MRRYLYPQIKKADLWRVIKCALVGSAAAGIYGIIHDQITFTISPEYFTSIKFKQFFYADPGLGDRVFVAIIGFLATWWAGLFIGYCLGRRFIPGQTPADAARSIRAGLAVVLVSTVSSGIGGYLYGHLFEPDLGVNGWYYILKAFAVVNPGRFIDVVHIHNASYVGALIGLVCALVFVKKTPHTNITASSAPSMPAVLS